MSKNKRFIALSIAAIVFVSELSFGLWMAHWNHFVPGDAISRVANAYFVLFSRQPHLAAIGFVWNPLPSLLAIPILLANPWFPELASEGIAGIILTSLFASGTAAMLFRSFMRRKNSLLLSLSLVMLFSFNPFIFLYGSNGMSESIFIFFLVWCVTAFLDWLDSKSVISMTMIGFALALAFFTRYETIFFGLALACSMALIIWSNRKKEGQETFGISATYYKFEASEIIALLPVIYAGIIWIVLNWSIMGDGLFFLRSNYSNLAQSEGLSKNPIIAPVIGNLGNSLTYLCIRSLPFIFPLIAVLAMRLIRKELLKTDLVCLLMLIFSIPFMQIIMLYKGASYGWLRFFVYPLPLAFAWLPYELQKQRVRSRRLYIVSGCVTLILLGSCTYVTGYVMNNSRLAPEEYEAIHHSESSTFASHSMSQNIAKDLDRRLSNDSRTTVLMDSFNAFQIIIDMKQANKLVITSDLDFKKALNDPVGNKISYILVPRPTGVASLNAVNERYQDFYNKGAPFAKLEKTYGDNWRLYRVVKP
jgi:hypothetical protein